MEIVAVVFEQFAKTELDYRYIKDSNSEDVLKDTLETSMTIASRGKSGNGDFAELQKGIQNMKNFNPF